MAKKQVLMTMGGVLFTSTPLSFDDAETTLSYLQASTNCVVSMVDASVTTPAGLPDVCANCQCCPACGKDAECSCQLRSAVTAEDDFVKADQFVACNIRTVVETANRNLELLRELDIPADAKHDIIRKMTSQGHGLDRWQEAAWQLVLIETLDNMGREGDKPPQWTLVNGGFPTANQDDRNS